MGIRPVIGGSLLSQIKKMAGSFGLRFGGFRVLGLRFRVFLGSYSYSTPAPFEPNEALN